MIFQYPFFNQKTNIIQYLKNNLGLEGENFASDYLIKNGYEILHRNWWFDRAEIDIIAQTEKLLIVVEVKTRTNNFFQSPEAAVTEAKIKKICKATNAYIEKYSIEKEVRFDIIALLKDDNNQFSVKHLKNAFYYF